MVAAAGAQAAKARSRRTGPSVHERPGSKSIRLGLADPTSQGLENHREGSRAASVLLESDVEMYNMSSKVWVPCKIQLSADQVSISSLEDRKVRDRIWLETVVRIGSGKFEERVEDVLADAVEKEQVAAGNMLSPDSRRITEVVTRSTSRRQGGDIYNFRFSSNRESELWKMDIDQARAKLAESVLLDALAPLERWRYRTRVLYSSPQVLQQARVTARV